MSFYKESCGKGLVEWVQIPPGEIPVEHKRKIFLTKSNQVLELTLDGNGGFTNNGHF